MPSIGRRVRAPSYVPRTFRAAREWTALRIQDQRVFQGLDAVVHTIVAKAVALRCRQQRGSASATTF